MAFRVPVLNESVAPAAPPSVEGGSMPTFRDSYGPAARGAAASFERAVSSVNSMGQSVRRAIEIHREVEDQKGVSDARVGWSDWMAPWLANAIKEEYPEGITARFADESAAQVSTLLGSVSKRAAARLAPQLAADRQEAMLRLQGKESAALQKRTLASLEQDLTATVSKWASWRPGNRESDARMMLELGGVANRLAEAQGLDERGTEALWHNVRQQAMTGRIDSLIGERAIAEAENFLNFATRKGLLTGDVATEARNRVRNARRQEAVDTATSNAVDAYRAGGRDELLRFSDSISDPNVYLKALPAINAVMAQDHAANVREATALLTDLKDAPPSEVAAARERLKELVSVGALSQDVMDGVLQEAYLETETGVNFTPEGRAAANRRLAIFTEEELERLSDADYFRYLVQADPTQAGRLRAARARVDTAERFGREYAALFPRALAQNPLELELWRQSEYERFPKPVVDSVVAGVQAHHRAQASAAQAGGEALGEQRADALAVMLAQVRLAGHEFTEADLVGAANAIYPDDASEAGRAITALTEVWREAAKTRAEAPGTFSASTQAKIRRALGMEGPAGDLDDDDVAFVEQIQTELQHLEESAEARPGAAAWTEQDRDRALNSLLRVHLRENKFWGSDREAGPNALSTARISLAELREMDPSDLWDGKVISGPRALMDEASRQMYDVIVGDTDRLRAPDGEWEEPDDFETRTRRIMGVMNILRERGHFAGNRPLVSEAAKVLNVLLFESGLEDDTIREALKYVRVRSTDELYLWGLAAGDGPLT